MTKRISDRSGLKLITREDVDKIGKAIRELVPTLRNESLLPDVEYEVEWSVPVLPEPLSFMRLTRRENRADPVVTMGCAMIVTLGVLGGHPVLHNTAALVAIRSTMITDHRPPTTGASSPTNHRPPTTQKAIL